METWKDGRPKSEIELLLEKNAYGSGLSAEEEQRAWHLIYHPEYMDGECWVCPKDKKHPAIYDTGLCQGHARYALITRK